MYKVKIFGQSFDKLKIDESRGCIDLYAKQDYIIHPNQIFMLAYNVRIELGGDIVAVPYSKDRKFKLYYPNGFGTSYKIIPRLKLAIDGRIYTEDYEVKEGSYLATYRFMTTQFHELMKAGKDKGLRSAFIKIELSNEQVF